MDIWSYGAMTFQVWIRKITLGHIFFLMFIYFWDRERQSMSGGGAEREGDTESKAGSRLWAVSTEPNVGLKLTDREIMTWAEVRRSTDWATQAPLLGAYWKMTWAKLEVCKGTCWKDVIVNPSRGSRTEGALESLWAYTTISLWPLPPHCLAPPTGYTPQVSLPFNY